MLRWNLNPEASKNVKAPIRPKQYARMVISGLKEEEAIGFEHEWNDLVLMEQKVYADKAKLILQQAEMNLWAVFT